MLTGFLQRFYLALDRELPSKTRAEPFLGRLRRLASLRLSAGRAEKRIRLTGSHHQPVSQYDSNFPFLISVIVCAHNPRPEYLCRTLTALREQSLPTKHWELLLVDNVCGEALATQVDLSWHRQARHLREYQLGHVPARLCGIKAASGGLLIFVDDDNVLSTDYLERAAAIPKAYPHIGVFGAGVVTPEFEV